MKRSKVLMICLALLLILPLVATACTPGETTAKMADEQKIVYNMGAEPPQLNTPLTTDVVSFTILNHVMEGLTRRDNNDNVVPGMAEKWDISDDGMTYTFHLRDAKWSNGDMVTAGDFAFAIQTLLDPATAAPYAYFAYTIKNAAAVNSGEADASELGVKVIDEKTLEITLEAAYSYFLDTMAFGVMMPINESYYNEVGADNYGMEADQMVYNGPYEITSWEHDVDLVMTKRDDYWNADEINLTEITGVVIIDAQAAYTSFKSGEVDMVGLADAAMVQDADANGYTPMTYPDGATFYLEFNLANDVMANQKIRTAVTYALDRQSFVDKILNNSSLPALAFTTPAIRDAEGSGSFHDMVGDLIKDDNSEEAKQLYAEGLAELGMDNIELSMISDDGERAVLYANAIAQYLKENLGITLNVESMPFKSRLERMENKDFDVVFAGWGPDYNDPMTFLDMFETGNGNNHTSYSSAAYDALLADARATLDDEDRYAIYVEMETLLMTDLPIAPVYFRIRDYVTIDNLKNVHRSAFQDINFLYAYLEA